MSNLSLNMEQIAIIVAMTIAVTKGVTEFAKIENGKTKQLITIVVGLYLMVNAMYNDNQILALFNTIIVILFSASGIYNFIPNQNQEIQVLNSVDVTNLEEVEDNE